MDATSKTEDFESEVAQPFRATQMVVGSLAALTVLLIALAFAGVRFVSSSAAFDPMLAGALRIAILMFGIGAVALRRTKFAAMRLQDIGALGGTKGLLDTLRSTTQLVALIGGAIALMGFVIFIITGDKFDMLYIGIVALVVLLYSYPRLTAWRRVVREFGRPGEADTSAKG